MWRSPAHPSGDIYSQSFSFKYLRHSGVSPESPPVSLYRFVCVCEREEKKKKGEADPPRASGRVFEYPDVLGLFWGQMVYSLKLKFRPELSVIGEEGPALDTALEGTLPSFKKIRRGFSLLTGLTPQNMKSIHVLTSSIDPCWKY